MSFCTKKPFTNTKICGIIPIEKGISLKVTGGFCMNITIVGRRFNVTDDLKAKIELKLGKLDKFFDDQANANVTMRSERNKEILETTITYKGTMFRSEVADETISAAIDKSIDIIERQIRKNKTRLQNRFKNTSVEKAYYELPDEEQDEINITRTKKFALKPMSVEEAILQMNLLGHEFFMFKNQDNGDIQLVYRKKNNEYGLIEPVDE